MNICFLTTAYPDTPESPRGHFIQQIVSFLIKDGYQVSVVTPQIYKDTKLYDQHVGENIYRFQFLTKNKPLIKYERISIFRMLTFFISALVKTFQVIRKNRINLIHSHWIIPSGIIGIIASKIFNLPHVVTLRGDDILIFPYKNIILFNLTKYILRSSSHIIAVSSEIKERVITDFNIKSNKIDVIPNGVNTSRFRPISQRLAREKLGLPTSKKIILFVGEMIERKGLKYILQSIPEIINDRSDAFFLFLGFTGGPYKEEMLSLQLLPHLKNHIAYFEDQPPRNVPIFLNASDVLLLPSLWEGLPNVILEALACGIPVIGTDIGGIKEVISNGYNGFKINPKSSSEIINSVLTLLNDDHLYKKIKNNCRKSIEKYDMENQVKKMSEIYQDLIKER